MAKTGLKASCEPAVSQSKHPKMGNFDNGAISRFCKMG